MQASSIYENLKHEIAILKNELQEKTEEYLAQNEAIEAARLMAEENERLLHSLVEAAASKIGQDFFDNIVLRLSEWLNAECVVIGQKMENDKIKAVPLYLDGKISHEFSYELKGTPCDITTRKGYCAFPENVINIFPKDKLLVDLNAEGYIGTALYNKSGEINGVICAVSRKKLHIPPYAKDIMKIIGARVSAEIERIEVEEALKKSEAELRESNSAKDKFFSIIAHDLKNPFNSLLGFSELLVSKFDELDKERQVKIFELINQTVKNTYNLLENLLMWSLTQRGLIKYKPVRINLKSLVIENIKIFQDIASEKQISIEKKSDTNQFVLADINLLSVIIRNLLSNAIKFTSNGGTVSISYGPNEEGGQETVLVSVTDSGVGIEADRLSKLFSLDENHSTEGTNIEKGTGLGLILCKEFVEMHNGRIYVESEVGRGSKFTFTLKAG